METHRHDSLVDLVRPKQSVLKILLIFYFIIHADSTDKNKPNTCGKADLVIGVDASWSINYPSNHPANQNFKDFVTPFAHKLVELLDEKRFRTGYYAWATKQETIYPISDNLTKTEKFDLIDKTPYLATNTWTGAAIEYGVNLFLNHEASVRPAIPRILLIMTDGDPFPPNQNLTVQKATKLFHQHGITPIAVGVGDFYKFEGLFDITGKNDSIYTGGFNDLPQIAETIQAESIYFPVNALPSELVIISTAANCWSFICCKDTESGLDVIFDIFEGKAEAYYSFVHTTEELSPEKNQGVLKDGILSDLPTDELDRGKELCVAVINGPDKKVQATLTCTPHTPEVPELPDGSCGSADVVIGIDASWSIEFPDKGDPLHATGHFKKTVLKFTEKLVELLHEVDSRTGLFVWSTSTKEVFTLGNKLSLEDKLKLVATIPYLGQNTWTGKAIEFGQKMFSEQDLPLRKDVPQVLVIMTDGEPFPLDLQEPTVADAIRNLGVAKIKAIAVGVGEFAIHQGLLDIAKTNDSVFTSEWEGLIPLADAIKDLTRKIPLILNPCEPYSAVTGNCPHYFCFDDTASGLQVDFSVVEGKAKAYYSFKDQPPNLTPENNQGALEEGTTSLPNVPEDKGQQICIGIVADASENSTYTIKVCPNTTIEPPIDPEGPNITTTTESSIGECKMVDVVIGIDASWSIEYPGKGTGVAATGYFKDVVLKFSQRLVKLLRDEIYRTGFFVWSTLPETIFELDDVLTFEEKQDKIEGTPFQGGNTWTGRAIEHGQKMFEKLGDPSRVDVDKILVIMTDGEPFPHIQSPTVEDSVNNLDKDNIKAYAVGVGEYDLYEGLLNIAKTNDSIFTAPHWIDLVLLADKIKGRMCPGKGTTTDSPIDPEPEVPGNVTTTTEPPIDPVPDNTTEPPTGDCKEIDVVIGIDASWSIEYPGKGTEISPTGYFKNVVLKFTDKLVSILDTSNSRTGLFVWSTNPETRFELDNTLSKEDKAKNIASTPFQGGNTRTGRAIEHGHKMLVDKIDPSRLNVEQILVIMTDGEPFPRNQSPTVKEAVKHLDDDKIKAYAVGVGEFDIYGGLLDIAKTNDSIVFAGAWDDLIALADKIKGKICKDIIIIDPPEPPPETECPKVDVIIGIDASWSIEYPGKGTAVSPTGYFQNVVLKFTEKLVTILDSSNSRTGLFVWSTNPETRFELDNTLSKEDKAKSIASTPFQGGNTWTGRAIEYGRKMLLDMNDPSRGDVEKILVIMTDGEPFPRIQSPTVEEAVKHLDDDKIKAYAVGVGEFDIYGGLLDIAKTNDSIVFAGAWDDLIALADKIKGKICKDIIIIDPPEPPPETECPKVDVIIGIDASWSIEFPGKGNGIAATGYFKNIVLEFVRRLAELLDGEQYRTGFFVWSNTQVTVFGLNEELSGVEKSDKIDDTPYLHANTWTGKAIDYGRKMFEEMSDPIRSDVAKILIIMTDGEPFPRNQTPTVEQAIIDLVKDGIIAYAVGVGDFDIHQGLVDIAGSEDKIFSSTGWDNLIAQADKIYDKMCNNTPTEPPIGPPIVSSIDNCGKADFVIGLDASDLTADSKTESDTNDYGKKVLLFTHKLIETLNEEHFRTGVFIWSNTTEAIYSITDELLKAEKLEKIDKAPYPHEKISTTLTGNAIVFGTKMLTDSKIPEREGVPKVLLILTNGEPLPADAKVSVKDAMKKADKLRINTIAIGVGKSVKFKGLLDIARKNDSVFLSEITDLELVAEQIRSYACFIPAYAVDNVEYERTDKQGYSSYFCFKDIAFGVEVILLNKEGGAKGYYSFVDTPKTLSKEKSQGELQAGQNILEYDKEYKNNDLCVLVITGTESEYNIYSIRFNPLVDPDATTGGYNNERALPE